MNRWDICLNCFRQLAEGKGMSLFRSYHLTVKAKKKHMKWQNPFFLKGSPFRDDPLVERGKTCRNCKFELEHSVLEQPKRKSTT